MRHSLRQEKNGEKNIFGLPSVQQTLAQFWKASNDREKAMLAKLSVPKQGVKKKGIV